MKTILNTTKQIGFFTIALTVALMANFAYGQWADPTGIPPVNNAEAPINVSAEYQAKLGDLGALRIRSDQYCDAAGANCFTPSGTTPTPSSGGGVATVVATGAWSSGVLYNDVNVKSVTRSSNAWVVELESPPTGDDKFTVIANVASNAQAAVWVISPTEFRVQARSSNLNNYLTSRFSFVVYAPTTAVPKTQCQVQFDYEARTDSGSVVRELVAPNDNLAVAIGMWQHHDDNLSFPMTEVLGTDAWGGSFWDSSEKIRVGYLANTLIRESAGFHQAKEDEAGNNFEYEEFELITGRTATFVTGAVQDIPAAIGSMTATVLSCTDV